MSALDPIDPALKKAYALLARRDRSEGEIRIKLQEKGIPAEVVVATLERLKSSGYLDDERYLLAATRSLVANRRLGDRRIEMTLRGKGFGKEEIRTALSQVRGEIDEGETLRHLIAREREKNPLWDVKAKRRLFQRLLSRGFAPAEILKYMGEYKEEFIDDHDGQ